MSNAVLYVGLYLFVSTCIFVFTVVMKLLCVKLNKPDSNGYRFNFKFGRDVLFCGLISFVPILDLVLLLHCVCNEVSALLSDVFSSVDDRIEAALRPKKGK